MTPSTFILRKTFPGSVLELAYVPYTAIHNLLRIPGPSELVKMEVASAVPTGKVLPTGKILVLVKPSLNSHLFLYN